MGRPTISRLLSVATATAIVAATAMGERRSRSTPPARGLEGSGVRPEMGTRLPRAAAGGAALVAVLARLADRALGDARRPHRPGQCVAAPGRDAADPLEPLCGSTLDYRHPRLLAGFQHGRASCRFAARGCPAAAGRLGATLPASRRAGERRRRSRCRACARSPLRPFGRAGERSCRPAPIGPSAAIRSGSTISAPLRRKAPAAAFGSRSARGRPSSVRSPVKPRNPTLAGRPDDPSPYTRMGAEWPPRPRTLPRPRTHWCG